MWKPIRWKCSCGKNSFPVSAISGSESWGEARSQKRRASPDNHIPQNSENKPRDLYFSKALFDGLFSEGLIYGGNLPFLLCFTLYLRAISKYKPLWVLYLEERLNRRFFVLWVWGAYIILEGLIHVCRGAYFQNFTVYANSPGYGTDLSLSRTGQQISWIKWSFELFCALHVHVVCNN